LAVFGFALLVAYAQDVESSKANAQPVLLGAQRQQLQARIAELATLVGTTDLTEGTPTAVAAAAELKLLRALDLVYLHHQETIDLTADAAQQRDRLQDELETIQATKPPVGQTFSWLLWDDCRDRLAAEESRARSYVIEIDQARDRLEGSLAESDRAERNRRKAYDETGKSSAGERGEQEYRQRLATLASAVAKATVDLRRAELKLKTTQQEAVVNQQDWLQAKIDRMREHVTFSEADLKERNASFSAYATELRDRLDEAQQSFRQVNDWLSSRSSSSAAGVEPPQAAADTSLDPADDNPSRAWSINTLEALRRVCHEEVVELERRVAEFESVADSPTQRFKFVNHLATVDELKNWSESCEQLSLRLADEDRRLAMCAGELLQDLATSHREARLKTDASANARAESAALAAALERRLRTVEFSQRHVLALRRGVDRFLADLHVELGDGHGTSWSSWIPVATSEVWNYELAAVGDSPITIEKISKGLAGFLLGLIVAAVASRFLGRRVLPRIGLNRGASEAFRTLSFYAICLVFGLLALELAHVPLTAFTFLGGAVAIGVGFGCQNILNNFISGLILLAEQPIRMGDLIKLGDLHGTIERIGARSTVVRTGSNVEIIVPNSKLLEDNVTNITRSDNRFRTQVNVGVAYGSPVTEVKRHLLRAAIHAHVLEHPEPFVLFADFADNSLNFQLHFWVRISSLTECLRIESDVREAIDLAFREAQISIAFPQRDLHLDSIRPLEIRLLDQQAQVETLPFRKSA